MTESKCLRKEIDWRYADNIRYPGIISDYYGKGRLFSVVDNDNSDHYAAEYRLTERWVTAMRWGS